MLQPGGPAPNARGSDRTRTERFWTTDGPQSVS